MAKRKLETRIKQILDKWIERLALQDYEIYYEISDKVSPNCAEVGMDSNYKSATITIYPKSLDDVEKNGYHQSLEHVLLHELMHVVVAKSFDRVDELLINHPQFLKSEEYLVEMVTKALLNER